MKRFLTILLLTTVSALAADVHFYYLIEQVPASVPGASLQPEAVLVQVASSDPATACVAFSTTSDSTRRTACVSGSSTIRINLGAASGDYSIDSIGVTVGGVTKTIQAPAPTVKY